MNIEFIEYEGIIKTKKEKCRKDRLEYGKSKDKKFGRKESQCLLTIRIYG